MVSQNVLGAAALSSPPPVPETMAHRHPIVSIPIILLIIYEVDTSDWRELASTEKHTLR